VNDFFTPFFASAPAAAIAYPQRIVGDVRSASGKACGTSSAFGRFSEARVIRVRS
jgi:hypothetical protein